MPFVSTGFVVSATRQVDLLLSEIPLPVEGIHFPYCIREWFNSRPDIVKLEYYGLKSGYTGAQFNPTADTKGIERPLQSCRFFRFGTNLPDEA